MYPSEYLYSKEHEWILVEGDICTLGITSYAQGELGEVVFVELPEVGSQFNSEDEIGSIESVKAVAEIYTPVSGEVTEVNSELEDAPEVVNDDPHVDGWLVKIKMSDMSQLDDLMDAEAYQELVDEAS